MGTRRRDRWTPDEQFNVPPEARGDDVRDLAPAMPVRSWVQLPDRLIRVEVKAMAPDAALVE